MTGKYEYAHTYTFAQTLVHTIYSLDLFLFYFAFISFYYFISLTKFNVTVKTGDKAQAKKLVEELVRACLKQLEEKIIEKI